MLLDSNIIIYASLPEYAALRQWIEMHTPAISAISYVEVLGYYRLTASAREDFRRFFETAGLFPLDQPVLDEAVRIRQLRRMSLGDSLIAATAPFMIECLSPITFQIFNGRLGFSFSIHLAISIRHAQYN